MSNVTKTAIVSALAAGIPVVDVLPGDQCPMPNFDDLAQSVHEAICKVDTSSFERDKALYQEYLGLKSQVEGLDPDGVADTVATIKGFIDKIDKDGDGNIDGLAGLISATETLGDRATELERRANIVDQKMVSQDQKIQSNTDQLLLNQQAIQELQSREDKEGISEERAYEIAADMVCKGVLKPMQTAVSNFNDAVQAIDCGAANHTAFMDALSAGTAIVMPGDDAGEAGGTSGSAGSV